MKTRWILLILTVLFLWAVISRFTQLEQLRSTLQQGQWTWLLAAFVSISLYFIVFAASYQAAFTTVEIQSRTWDLIPLTLGALFVNLVVPAGIAGGTALFAQEFAKQGKPATRTTIGVLIQLGADFVAFAFLLIPGLIYLFFERDLKVYEIGAALLLLSLTVGLTVLLLSGIWRPHWIHRLFEFAQRAANRVSEKLRHSPLMGEDWALNRTEEFNQASVAVAKHPLGLLRTIAAALLAHLLDLTTLYLLFRAFNQPIGLGTLVAGYAVGILFWVVSITAQGIGIVEGVMALTFVSLGISGAVATTVVLAFRGLSLWIPLLLGFVAVQRMRVFAPKQILTESWRVRFVAILVGLMGVINVLSAVTPSLTERLAILDKYLPLEVLRGGHLTAGLAGFALLILAINLNRRKQVAWVMTLVVLGLSIISHLLKGLDYEEALFAVGLIIVLWRMRGHFHARSDPPSLRQGIRVLAGATLFTLAYGVIGFYLLDRHYSVNFGFGDAVRQTVVMFTQFYNPGLTPITHFGRYFSASIYLVGLATFSYAGLLILRPILLRSPATEEERLRAKDLVERYGHSSLARFLLFDDKHYFFNSGGSVIGFELIGRTAITLGDPVGPKEDLLSAIKSFSAFCNRNDWLPVFYQTLPETLELYKQADYDAVSVGEEGIVDLATFMLEGGEMKPLRSPFNKLTKAGHKFIVHDPPIPNELLEELRLISDEWLNLMHGSEKKFSLGWFDEEYIRTSPIAAVHSPEGWISAFANLVPEYQLNELTIDLMRHRMAIENGTMEFLFVSLIQSAKGKGYDSFNLGLSSLSGVGELPGDPAVERLMHFIYEHANQFYSFTGLHYFKEKFHPRWSPRYLIYRGPANLAAAWLAVVRANTGNVNLLVDYFKRKKQVT